MAEITVRRAEDEKTKITSVPIAVTPEGFWCCPSQIVFQKSLKPQNSLNNPKSPRAKQTSAADRRAKTGVSSSDAPALNSPSMKERTPHQKHENAPKKLAIAFGEAAASDLKVMLLGKQGVAAKLSVHARVLVENSAYFAEKMAEQQPVFVFLEMDDGEDAEIYVETIGLMYCKQAKRRLTRQTVSRVLGILKVAQKLGFKTCIQSCLEYLEAVPWVGEEEEENVVSSVLCLKHENNGVEPVLRRVSSEIAKPPEDAFSHVLELVLKSNEERARREMKSIVLKLLREHNSLPSSSRSSDSCNETIYKSCRSSLDSLLSLFGQAAEPDYADKPVDTRDQKAKLIAREADNLCWLLDILAYRQAADDFAVVWANQQVLASLHTKLPTVSRHNVSMITARLFVGIGRGELLSSRDTRCLLVRTWMQPLINDYSWLRHGCRSFDQNAVEEGIGRTILTLPLEDQQYILLSWLGAFLKSGDNCPNLQRAFEVWWRRTFIRPYVEPAIESSQIA